MGRALQTVGGRQDERGRDRPLLPLRRSGGGCGGDVPVLRNAGRPTATVLIALDRTGLLGRIVRRARRPRAGTDRRPGAPRAARPAGPGRDRTRRTADGRRGTAALAARLRSTPSARSGTTSPPSRPGTGRGRCATCRPRTNSGSPTTRCSATARWPTPRTGRPRSTSAGPPRSTARRPAWTPRR